MSNDADRDESNVVDFPNADADLRPSLIYTVAFDPPGSEGCRMLAKMLSSSLLRTYFTGDILVFRNSESPLFLVERKGLEEVYIDTPEIHGLEGAEYSWCWKYKVREHVLRWMEMNGGVGAWIVKASRFNEAMDLWRKIHRTKPERERYFADQPAFNKLLLSEKFTASPFSGNSVMFPVAFHPSYFQWRRAGVAHFCGDLDSAMKTELMYGVYTMRFYGDAASVMMDLYDV